MDLPPGCDDRTYLGHQVAATKAGGTILREGMRRDAPGQCEEGMYLCGSGAILVNRPGKTRSGISTFNSASPPSRFITFTGAVQACGIRDLHRGA